MAEQEKTNEQPLVLLASSPHINSPVTTQKLMRNVLIALIPASLFGVITFGWVALLNILVGIVSAMAGEAGFRRITKQDIRIKDCSAAITGLLLALVIPPTTPLWITALGAIFAVIVAKELFGGLGANVFNPALIGRAFLIMSFPAAITTWEKPSGLIDSTIREELTDTFSAATPLQVLKSDDWQQFVSSDAMFSSDYFDVLKMLLIGNHAGCIGETSMLMILIGFIYLLFTKTIDWRAPVTMIGSTAFISLILGMDPVFAVLSGGVFFAAVFMVTDYVTAPITSYGKLLFGFGAGLITVLIRKWGDFPEGVTYGILVMNACTPFLNRLLQKKYGFIPKPKGAGK